MPVADSSTQQTERPPRGGLSENPVRCNKAGQPGHSDRPVQAPRVKFAFSFVVPAAISSAASDTSKARILSFGVLKSHRDAHHCVYPFVYGWLLRLFTALSNVNFRHRASNWERCLDSSYRHSRRSRTGAAGRRSARACASWGAEDLETVGRGFNSRTRHRKINALAFDSGPRDVAACRNSSPYVSTNQSLPARARAQISTSASYGRIGLRVHGPTRRVDSRTEIVGT